MYVSKSSLTVQHSAAPLRSLCQQPGIWRKAKCCSMINDLQHFSHKTLFVFMQVIFSTWVHLSLSTFNSSSQLTHYFGGKKICRTILSSLHCVWIVLLITTQSMLIFNQTKPSSSQLSSLLLLPLCALSFFLICSHANFLHRGRSGLWLIKCPEEGILRDLSSQSGTLHSYPV